MALNDWNEVALDYRMVFAKGSDTEITGTTETDLLDEANGRGSLKMPTSFGDTGDTVRIQMAGLWTAPASVPTMRWRSYVGSTLIGDSAALAAPEAATDSYWYLEQWWRIIPAGGAFATRVLALGHVFVKTSAYATDQKRTFNSSGLIELASTNEVTVKFQWGGGIGSKSLKCRFGMVEAIR